MFGFLPKLTVFDYNLKMISVRKISAVFLLAGVFVFCRVSDAYAQPSEQLFFNAKPSIVKATAISTFLENQKLEKLEQYVIAQTDLNEDGIEEVVLKPKSCEGTQERCTYLILAEKQDVIMSLGVIYARKLLLAGTFSHGVQDFLAFRNDNNDYEYVRYVWSPVDAKYMVKQEN